MGTRKNIIALFIVAFTLPGCGMNHVGIPSPLPPSESVSDRNARSSATVSSSLSAKNITQIHLSAALAEPDPITRGLDGNIWVGEGLDHGLIAKITPAGAVTEYSLTSGGEPTGLAPGAGGAVWFVQGRSCTGIGKIDPSGHITEFSLPVGDCGGNGITLGPDANMWFTDGHTRSIGRITPSGSVTEFPLPLGEAPPNAITAGADGNLWFSEFTEPRTTQNVGKITTSGHITLYHLGRATETRGIVRGPDGNIYVSDLAFTLHRITPSGIVTAFVSSTISYPAFVAMAVGPDNQIWAVSRGGQMQKFDPTNGTFSNVIDLPSNQVVKASGDKGIAQGSDADMWFTSGDSNSDSYVGVYEP